MMTKRKKMIAYNSNEGSSHTGVVWLLWYAADSAHALGQLVAIDYSDSTPDVAFTYDRLGRQLTVTDVLGTRTNVYSPTDLLEERHPDGTALVRSYDAYGRASGIALGPDYAVGYGYDEYGRFSTVAVTNGATFTYSYLSNSSLLSGYTNDLGLAVAYEYEPLRDVKTLVSNAWFTNVISTFAYTYDALGRRTQRIDDGTVTNLFGYNVRSELVSAEMGTNTYSYAYDPIGNRTSSSENGVTNLYAANELNQYTALNPASSNPTPFTYDPDGNMTSDGTWSYTWDAENRLIEVLPLVTNFDSTLIQYMYDAQSRRIARREFAWNDYLGETTWYYVQGRAFRYDDWNLLQEQKPAILPRTPHPYISHTDLALTGIDGPVAAEYVWGLDLSVTLHGVGGIGGLIMQRHGSTNAFCFHDIHGNVTELTDEEATSIAHYMYDAFGGTSVQTCAQVGNTPFRFSSKYLDWSIGFYYYGYRFYSQMWGRWLSRDIISELGGVNLYQFVYNSPLSWFDSLGASPSGGEWYNQRPYNNEVGGPFVDVFSDTGSHVPHCHGFGGTGNTQGWTKQYRDVLVRDLPHRGAAEKIATILGELMREHGVTDDACYGGKVDQRVSIRHKTESFWIWKVCSRVVKLNKCHCGRCGGNNEMPDQLEDVTQDPSIYRCKQFMQSKTGSFIEMEE